jgi:hypothetical protein
LAVVAEGTALERAVERIGQLAGDEAVISRNGQMWAGRKSLYASGEAQGVVRAFTPKNAAIADYLERATGVRPTPNPLEGVAGAGRQGDAIWNGLKVEFKTLDSGASPATIRNVVNESVRRGGQARNMVIDARGTGLGRAAAERGISRALGIRRGKIDGITVIGDDYMVGWGPAR